MTDLVKLPPPQPPQQYPSHTSLAPQYPSDTSLARQQQPQFMLPKIIIQPVQYMELYFENIYEHLLEHIKQAKYIVGCVAWLTDMSVLDLMIQKLQGVSLIVQTETYLTRNYKWDKWRDRLKDKYRQLPNFPWTEWGRRYPTLALPSSSSSSSSAVRIAGEKMQARRQKVNTSQTYKKQVEAQDEDENKKQMMHLKSLLFFDANLVATGLWTGSYNPSFRARHSWEYVTYFRDAQVCREFFLEFRRVYETSRDY